MTGQLAMIYTRCALFLGMVSLALLYGQNEAVQSDRKTNEQRTREFAVSLALEMPSEIAAEALVDLARITPKGKARIEILLRAFWLAEHATYGTQLRSVPGSSVDTVDGFLGMALKLGIDRCSIQSSIINELLTVDPSRALDYFTRMTAPESARSTCGGQLIADPSAYYTTATALFKAALTPAQRKTLDPVGLAARVFHQDMSPAQLSASAKMLADIAPVLSAADVSLLAALLGQSLLTGRQDFQEFTFVRSELFHNVAVVLRMFGERQMANITLLQQLGEYVLKQWRGDLCTAGNVGQQISVAAREYNDIVNKMASPNPSNVKRLDAADFSVGKVARPQRPASYWATAQANELQSRVKQLTTLKQSESSDLARTLLRDISAWNATEKAHEGDIFNQKCVLLRHLYATSQLPLRLEALSTFVSVLASPPAVYDPTIWRLHLGELFDSTGGADKAAERRVLIESAGRGGPVMAFVTVRELTRR